MPDTTSPDPQELPDDPGNDHRAGRPAPVPALELPPEPKTPGLAKLREWTTTILALVILGLTTIMMLRTFVVGETFENMKDVMLYALPLLGSVIGYYFGRVPAERRAETAETQAGKAQETAQAATAKAIQTRERADQKLAQVKLGVERAKAKFEMQPAVMARRLEGRDEAEGGAASAAYRELDAVSKML